MEKSFDFGRVLKNHEKKHKIKPAQFISVAGGVQKRLERNIKYRKSSRLTVFDSIRNLPRCESPVPVVASLSKEEHRRQQLEKWKEEKEKRKKEAASQKKKPFVAGVTHAPLKYVPPPPPKAMPSTSGRVTRSQSARQQNVTKAKADAKQKDTKQSRISFAPKNASFQPPKNLVKGPILALVNKSGKEKINFVFNPILPNNQKQTKNTRSNSQITAKNTAVETRTTRNNVKDVADTKKPKITKKSSPKAKRNAKMIQSSSSSEVSVSSTEKSPVIKAKTPRKSLQKELKQFTPKNPVPKSESSSEERLRSPKSPVEAPMTPETASDESENVSPYVTMSRGKDNARREMKKKIKDGFLDEDASNMDSVIHFQHQLDSEIKRMTEICEAWEKIQEYTPLTESIQEEVLAAVGQARLLMGAKLQQFASLVQRAARPRAGDALVTPADLQGFWDMVFMQVENIDMRFKKLDELRARGWVEEQPVEVKRAVPRNNVKRPAKPAAAKAAGGPSRLREMIAAARKAKKDQEDSSAPSSVEDKTFEAGFFCVTSPVRSSAPATPQGKPSLLKSVLSSEAKKSASKTAASYAMLRASILSRNVDTDGVSLLPQTPMTPINLHATPARSILKSSNVASEKRPSKKSIKVVLFDEDKEEQANAYVGDEDIEDLIDGVNKLPDLTDSGVSSMDVEKDTEQKENKENNRRKGRLVRQDATEDSHQVMTRSRRKSLNTSLHSEELKKETPRKSSRKKKALQELEVVENVLEDRIETPKRSVRSRKSTGLQSVMA